MGRNQSKCLTNAELQEGLQDSRKPSEKHHIDETSATSHSSSAFDRESFLAYMGDDPAFIREICELFISSYPEVMIQLREAIQARHASRSQAAAHQLKGMVANFSARPAVELLRKIEELAKNGGLQNIQRLYYDLELQMSCLKVALAGVILRPASNAAHLVDNDEKAL
jgi:HPt (histidine-containing phosphotransfer) domain-containing protein